MTRMTGNLHRQQFATSKTPIRLKAEVCDESGQTVTAQIERREIQADRRSRQTKQAEKRN